MSQRILKTLCSLQLYIVVGSPLYAVTYKVGGAAGLMQQPTSQYYHTIYGGFGELASNTGKLALRYSYIERPRFYSAGFSEQEFGNFLTVGTYVWASTSKVFTLNAHIGGGRMQGYITAEKDKDGATSDLPMRKYHLNGLTAIGEGELKWKLFNIALSHQTFVGFDDNDQLSSYVAWPYNYYMGRIGFLL